MVSPNGPGPWMLGNFYFAGVLKGSVVWITGASSGIGESLSYELARAGAKLALSGTNTERLRAVKDKCIGAT